MLPITKEARDRWLADDESLNTAVEEGLIADSKAARAAAQESLGHQTPDGAADFEPDIDNVYTPQKKKKSHTQDDQSPNTKFTKKKPKDYPKPHPSPHYDATNQDVPPPPPRPNNATRNTQPVSHKTKSPKASQDQTPQLKDPNT